MLIFNVNFIETTILSLDRVFDSLLSSPKRRKHIVIIVANHTKKLYAHARGIIPFFHCEKRQRRD